MKRSAIVAGGAGLGFGLMYFLDPKSGRRRRALVRDQAVRLTRDSREVVEKAARDLINRAQGLRHAGAQLFSPEQARSNRVLEQRVRAKLGRVSLHPSAIVVSAREGVIILRGPVLEEEVNGILAAAAGVRGVGEVRNELEPHREAGDIPALQVGGRRGIGRLRLMPATRLAAAAAGVGLLAYGLKKRKLLGAAAGLAGAALVARGVAEKSARRMAETGGRAAAPQEQAQPGAFREFERTMALDAPPEQVFRFLSSVDNLPQFLPSIRQIRPEPEDHVWGIAEMRGQPMEFNGFFRVTVESRRIDWGSDGAPMYRGWLQVAEAGGRSELTIHLEREGTDITDQMVDDVLDTIRRLVEQEGAGGVIGEERRTA